MTPVLAGPGGTEGWAFVPAAIVTLGMDEPCGMFCGLGLGPTLGGRGRSGYPNQIGRFHSSSPLTMEV